MAAWLALPPSSYPAAEDPTTLHRRVILRWGHPRLAGSDLPAMVALVGPSAVLGWLGWQRRWVAEDAFIDLRVVQHRLAGQGLVYNPGERAEAHTNLLWVALLASAHWVLAPLPNLAAGRSRPRAGAER
jgi:hypothetical protein